MCGYCEDLKKVIKRKRELENIENPTNLDNEQYIELQKYEFAIQSHKNNNNKQRKAFFESIEKLENNEAILLMDFKENIKLGGSQREVNRIYYSKSQRTILCIIVITNKGRQYFDFVSEDLCHDAEFVEQSIIELISSPEFVQYNIKQVHFWSDGGKHFRNGQLQNFYKDLFLKKVFSLVTFNYFIEYHEKSYCDSHFSVISKIIENYETGVDQIRNTSHLIFILKDNFLKISTKKEKEIINIHFLNLNLLKERFISRKLKLKIRNYFTVSV